MSDSFTADGASVMLYPPATTTTVTADPALRAERVSKLERERLTTYRAVELRGEPDEGDPYVAVGYASLFDSPYEVTDWLGSYVEVVKPGAFTKTLAERADVRFLLNHEDLPLARTKSGTLALTQDDVGLHVEATLEPTDPDVKRIIPKMLRGDLDQMSFAFEVIRQEWNGDYTERSILEVKLYDVALVTFAANPATWMDLRGSELISALADADPDELVRSCRDASLPLFREQLLTARDNLDALLAAGAPAEPVEPAADNGRDAGLSLDLAKKRLEILKLKATS